MLNKLAEGKEKATAAEGIMNEGTGSDIQSILGKCDLGKELIVMIKTMVADGPTLVGLATRHIEISQDRVEQVLPEFVQRESSFFGLVVAALEELRRGE